MASSEPICENSGSTMRPVPVPAIDRIIICHGRTRRATIGAKPRTSTMATPSALMIMPICEADSPACTPYTDTRK